MAGKALAICWLIVLKKKKEILLRYTLRLEGYIVFLFPFICLFILDEPEAFPVAAAAGGGVGAAVLIIAIVAVILVVWKRRSPKDGKWLIL